MNQAIDKNKLDVLRIFETFVAFSGDVMRTAVACNLPPETIHALATSEGWHAKVKEWTTLREGSTADVAVQVNRAVNFVQAHRLRSLVDKVVTELTKLEPSELVDKLSSHTRDKSGLRIPGASTFSARALTDLVKAAESAHLMTQRALGDTAQERPETGETRKGSSIALLVQQAMNAADATDVNSVEVVRKNLKGP